MHDHQVTNDVFLVKDLTTRIRETFTYEDGTPFPLQGKKLFIRLVNTDPATGTEHVVKLDIASGITVENAPGGIFSWAVTDAQADTLLGDDYVEVNLTIMDADDVVVATDQYVIRKRW